MAFVERDLGEPQKKEEEEEEKKKQSNVASNPLQIQTECAVTVTSTASLERVR
jgi:hypothetical protein